ncbi:MAG: hypothetical protein OHK0052_13340 [Anaerolineales bacterium]
MLQAAGLGKRLRLVIRDKEIRILPEELDPSAEDILNELAGCLGHESAAAYDFNLKIGHLYETQRKFI